MIIRGSKVAGHYWLPCLLVCGHPEMVKGLELCVDTGATTTSVFAEFAEIDCADLEQGEPVDTANGPQIPYILRNVILILRTSRGKLYPMKLDHVDVLELENPALAGILGMDVLSQFRVTLTENNVTLRL